MKRSPLHFLDRPAGLLAASLALAIAIGALTSSLLDFGVFLLAPSLVVWLLRRT